MAQPTTIVLAISRQFASGGSYIGQAVAQRLGLRYTDRDILARAAAESGLSEEELRAAEERAGGFWSNAVRQYSIGAPEAPFIAPLARPLFERDLFRLESAIIREIAARFDAVIVGRAGFYVLADYPGLVSVRVHAREEWRARRAMTVYGLQSEQEARELLRHSDRQRAKFIRTFTGRDWNDAAVHHLCVDTGVLGLEVATEIVVQLVARRMAGRGDSEAPITT
jgi:cytidylate kinase